MSLLGMWKEGRGVSSWLSHCVGHLRQAETREAGSSSTSDLEVWGNGGGTSLGSVPTAGAVKGSSEQPFISQQ